MNNNNEEDEDNNNDDADNSTEEIMNISCTNTNNNNNNSDSTANNNTINSLQSQLQALSTKYSRLSSITHTWIIACDKSWRHNDLRRVLDILKVNVKIEILKRTYQQSCKKYIREEKDRIRREILEGLNNNNNNSDSKISAAEDKKSEFCVLCVWNVISFGSLVC